MIYKNYLIVLLLSNIYCYCSAEMPRLSKEAQRTIAKIERIVRTINVAKAVKLQAYVGGILPVFIIIRDITKGMIRLFTDFSFKSSSDDSLAFYVSLFYLAAGIPIIRTSIDNYIEEKREEIQDLQDALEML